MAHASFRIDSRQLLLEGLHFAKELPEEQQILRDLNGSLELVGEEVVLPEYRFQRRAFPSHQLVHLMLDVLLERAPEAATAFSNLSCLLDPDCQLLFPGRVGQHGFPDLLRVLKQLLLVVPQREVFRMGEMGSCPDFGARAVWNTSARGGRSYPPAVGGLHGEDLGDLLCQHRQYLLKRLFSAPRSRNAPDR